MATTGSNDPSSPGADWPRRCPAAGGGGEIAQADHADATGTVGNGSEAAGSSPAKPPERWEQVEWGGFVDLVRRAFDDDTDTARTERTGVQEGAGTAATSIVPTDSRPTDSPAAGTDAAATVPTSPSPGPSEGYVRAFDSAADAVTTSHRPGAGQSADTSTNGSGALPSPTSDRDPTASPGSSATGERWTVPIRRSRPIVVGTLTVLLLAGLLGARLLAESSGRSGSDAVHAATQWLGAWAPTGVVLSDDAFVTGLRQSGWHPSRVTVPAACPAGGCRPNWLVSTSGLRSDASVATALAGSTPVAVFGSGDDRVEIRRSGAPPVDRATAEQQARTVVGQALADLPRLSVDPGARELLDTGRVDPRLLAMLAALAQRGELRVVDMPAVPGEDDAGQPRRQMLLAGPTAEGDALTGFFVAQGDPFQPTALTSTSDGVLVSYPPLAPPHLLDAFD